MGNKIIATAVILGLLTAGSAFATDLGYPGTAAGSIAGANAQQQQGQGQSQGHAVTGSGNSNITDSANVTFKDSFNGADPIRYLPIPSNIPMPSGPQIFGSPDYADRGPHFMSMLVLVNALNSIDLTEVKANDRGDVELVGQLLNIVDEGEEVEDADIQFILNDKGDVTETVPGFKPIAVATLKAKDNDTMNSATLAVRLAEYAKEVKGSKIVLVSEGTSKKLSSWGAGIGFSYNMATVGSDPSDQGQVGAGGTGVSWGRAEYFSLPYLTAIVGN